MVVDRAHGSNYAALQRNVLRLTSLSKQDATTIAKLRKELRASRMKEKSGDVDDQLRASEPVLQENNSNLSRTLKPESEFSVESQKPLQRRIDELQDEVSRLKIAERKMSEKYTALTNDVGSKVTVTSNTSEEKWREQLQAVSSHARSLLQRNKALEEQMKDATQVKLALSEAQVELEAKAASRQQLKLALNKSEQACKELRHRLEEKTKFADYVEDRRRRAASDLSQTTSDYLLLQGKYETQMKRCEQMTVQLTRAEEVARQLKSAQADLTAEKISAAHLNAKISSLMTKSAGMDALHERLSTSEGKVSELQLKLMKAKQQKESMAVGLEKFKIVVAELHPKALQAQKLQEENTLLNKKLQKIIARQAAAETEDVTVAELGESLSKAREDILVLVAEKESLNLKHAEEILILQQQLDKCREEKEVLSRDAREKYEAFSGHVASLTEAENKIVDLQNRLRKSKHLQGSMALAAEEDNSKLQKMTYQLHDATKLADEERTLRLATENRLKELESEAQRDENLTKELNALKEHVEQLKKEAHSTRQELYAAETARRYAETQLSETESVAEALLIAKNELKVTVSKLVTAEESSESAFTCLKCMNIMKSPVTCIPCGHSFCQTCLTGVRKYDDGDNISGESSRDTTSNCPECDEGNAKTDYYIENQLLENLCARYLFRQTALASLKNTTAALSARADSFKLKR